jgi:hypothetical protein
MGNTPDCCERDENIDNIIEERNEIFNFSPEDDKIPDDASFISNHGGEYPTETERPADFKYEAKYPKLVNREKIIIKNLPQDKIWENDDDQEELNQEMKFLEQQNLNDMNNAQKGQNMRLKQLFDLCNRNGKPRSVDDFDPNKYTMFYSKDDPYFYIDKNGIIPNNIKVYNEGDQNNLQIYQGDFNASGQRHGIGKCTTPYYILIGMWKNDKFSGWGRESRSNGDVFEGRYENGLLNGKGIFLNSKRVKYIGDFRNTRRWGKGELTTDKFLYQGDFYNNQLHGKGRIKFFRDGIEYKGSFNYDKIEGFGTFRWSNGDTYLGHVKNGKMDGYGIYRYSNGKEYKGFFNRGEKASDKMSNYEMWKKNGYGVSAGFPGQQNLGPNNGQEFNNQTQLQENNQFQEGMKPISVGSGSNNN